MIHPTADVKASSIGINTRIWQYTVVGENVIIGESCNICSHCFIESGVRLGARVTIKNGCMLYDGLSIGDNVFVGPGTVFTNDKKPMSGNTQFQKLSTIIKEGVSIGARVVILPGIVIGRRAIIGAGSVVTKDVPPEITVTGVYK